MFFIGTTDKEPWTMPFVIRNQSTESTKNMHTLLTGIWKLWKAFVGIDRSQTSRHMRLKDAVSNAKQRLWYAKYVFEI